VMIKGNMIKNYEIFSIKLLNANPKMDPKNAY
jgi:hypothetical protein